MHVFVIIRQDAPLPSPQNRRAGAGNSRGRTSRSTKQAVGELYSEFELHNGASDEADEICLYTPCLIVKFSIIAEICRFQA